MKKEVNLENRKITVVGTAHVSKKSRDEVKQVINELKPDLVAVELDEDRYASLKGEKGWREMNVGEAIRDGKGFLLSMNVLLAIYQRKIGVEQDIEPGAEMLAAAEAAEELGVETALVDRNINETFRRTLQELTLREKLKFLSSLLYTTEEVEPDELVDGDILENLVGEMKQEYPSLARTFLEERNSYMAEKLLERDFEHAVLVVGAAHLEGVVEELKQQNGYRVEDRKKLPWGKVVKYGIPAFIIGGIGYSFLKLGFGTGLQASMAWVVLNGLFSMIGAIIARSHPVTWITSFLAAPITSLNPTIGAGMVAAYVEAKVRPPTVEDLETVSDIDSYGELWHNQVGVVLLTFILVSIGSTIATLLSAGYIASLLGGA
jgi:pheromone shutdown-related protein TraB